MANSFSTKIPIVSGYNTVLAGTLPFSGTLIGMTLSNDIAVTWEVYIDRQINALDRVATLSLSAASSGGTLAANTIHYFRVTTVDALGFEGPPVDTLFSKKTGASATSSITITWTAVAGAVSYNVYASSSAGQETFRGNTAALTYTLTTPPVNQSLQVPTLPDIIIIAPTGSVIYPDVENILLVGKIDVFAKAGAAGNVAFSCLVSG